MKNLIYLFPVFIFLSCGGSENLLEQESANDTLYSDDHEWIVSARELKEKLGDLQASFTEIGNKEVEETICEEGETVPYTGNKNEMNIWLMATYMLDNFADSAFAKNDFNMPDVMIKSEIPLRDLNWLNFNNADTSMFNLYREYPDLTNIPKVKNLAGTEVSNKEMLQKAAMVLKALKDGLFVVIAITDYVPPKYVNDKEYETGHVMGYILFADWESGQLSCLSPLLAQNSAKINFDSPDGVLMNDDGLNIMLADLQEQTFHALDSMTRAKTGFTGNVTVNNAANLEKYKE